MRKYSILDKIRYKKLFQCLLKEEIKSTIEVDSLDGHTKPPLCMVKLSSTLIASGGRDGSIKIWNLITGNCIKTFYGNKQNIFCIIKLGEMIIASGEVPSIEFFGISRIEETQLKYGILVLESV